MQYSVSVLFPDNPDRKALVDHILQQLKILRLVVLSILIGCVAPAYAQQQDSPPMQADPGAVESSMCPQLEGKHVKVTGVLRNLMTGGRREPGEAPSSYFDLENPRWDCKLKKVYVVYPGRRLWCTEGKRVEVSGRYHDGSALFTGYYEITADTVRCN